MRAVVKVGVGLGGGDRGEEGEGEGEGRGEAGDREAGEEGQGKGAALSMPPQSSPDASFPTSRSTKATMPEVGSGVS